MLRRWRIKRKLRAILRARSLLPHHAKTGNQRFNLDQQLDIKTDRRTVMRIFYTDARASSYIFKTDVRSVLHVSNFNLNLRLGLISKELEVTFRDDFREGFCEKSEREKGRNVLILF